MKSDKIILILDLDGTITKTDNLIQFSMFMIKNQNKRRFILLIFLVFLHKLNLINNRDLKLFYARWILKGINVQSLKQMVELFLDSEAFKTAYNNEVLGFISGYGEAEKVIISANFSWLAEPIAKKINIPNQISINLESQNGEYSGKTKGIIPYGQAKIDAVKLFLKEKNYSKTIGIADSKSDLPLLKFLDEGYMVKYDNKNKSTTFIKV